MRVTRFYHPEPLKEHSEIELKAPAARHATRVLRLRPGDPVVVFDGRGGEFPAQVADTGRQGVSIRLAERVPVERESPLIITLVQGISRGERMDFTIQKSVELGVSAIIPVICERTVVRLDPARAEKRLRHWQGVIENACEQCGRDRLPELHPIENLTNYLSTTTASVETRLFLDPEGTRAPKDIDPPPGMTLLIGPEGGLSEAERGRVRDAGFQGVRLGPRILRTETAALTAIAAAQTLWGDFR
ncbi:MAG: 16S rRNA (uracil(1498)-N(3))-methyltransferase [Pseudomonadota bacterium]|nr:16S rRNA (uracil(1498)-N(3))-methyltransferase [Pseudomonadota bacterium]